MPLAAGAKLGPYEILAPLGAGGMGEVYRARDPRMGREVAIKVSAERFSDRFEREVHVVAALNHPHICHLYDVGPNYLVMELVEGPTLAERIASGPLPPGESLSIARQIAEALEAAHEQRIVHRDLKPANIKIKPDGTVKVLDFGLAKMGGAPAASTEDSPTFTMNSTAVGVILGTAAYMSPEQACGKAVDKRADIWAFGVVLYEVLTGRPPFHGNNIAETMASVVKDKPDLSGVPSQVRPLLERCLEKDPRKRLRDIGDMALLLEGVPRAEAYQKGPRWWIAWAIVACVLAVLTAALGVGLRRATRPPPPPLRPLMRLKVELGADTPLARANGGGMLALSPTARAWP